MDLNLVDSTFSHCGVSSNPLPVINKAKHIQWVRRDSTDELVVYTDNHIPTKISNRSIAWLIEPREIKPNGYSYVEDNYYEFKSIWTYDKKLLKDLPNAEFYPFGGCWINHNDRKIHKKSKLFSTISSSKDQTTGHKLRHQIISASFNEMDVFGRGSEQFSRPGASGYGPIDNKIEGLKDYYYHLAVENVKKDYWFTEKLIDCFVTGTIPIYWGCPSIGNYFNTDGMVLFNDLTELKGRLEQCTEKFYEDNLSAVRENFELAKKYTLAEDWIYRNIASAFKEKPFPER